MDRNKGGRGKAERESGNHRRCTEPTYVNLFVQSMYYRYAPVARWADYHRSIHNFIVLELESRVKSRDGDGDGDGG